MPSLQEAEANLREALDRLRVAHTREFPWSVRMYLMIEATIAMCESQVAASETVLRLVCETHSNMQRLREKVEALK